MYLNVCACVRVGRGGDMIGKGGAGKREVGREEGEGEGGRKGGRMV